MTLVSALFANSGPDATVLGGANASPAVATRDAPRPSKGPAASGEATSRPQDTVVLSPLAARVVAARALDAKPFSTVANEARTALDAQYADAKKNSARIVFDTRDPGRLLDFSDMDRRTVFAIASNSGGQFTHDEQGWAGGELTNRTQAALATAFLSNDPRSVPKAVLDYAATLSPEEQKSPYWIEGVGGAVEAIGIINAREGRDNDGTYDDLPIVQLFRDSLNAPKDESASAANAS